MRARGIDPNAPGGGRGGNGAGGDFGGRGGAGRGGAGRGGAGQGDGNAYAAGGGGQRTGRVPAAAAPAPAMASTSGATTIDALFGPLPVTETSGQVWTFKKGAVEGQGTLTNVRLRLGVSDGQQT